TDATTSQCYNPQTRDWAWPMLDKLGLPAKIFGNIVEPGANLGKLRPNLIEETGLRNAEVIVPAAHDTASAVLAVPTTVRVGAPASWCYISSGTWSLMGVETPTPVLTPECLKAGFTNEGGVLGTTRLLKNITGLWIIQECRRIWARAGREYSWSDLTRAAADAPTLTSFIDPDHPDFSAPGDMPNAIRAYCQRTGQSVPSSEGAVIRTAIESLALKYRKTLELIEGLTGTPIETIHIVGGGVQNETLCQAAADACGKPVVAGPVETTAAGNCLMQAIAVGAIGSIDEARAVIRASFPVKTYEPRSRDAWRSAYDKFLGILAQG
ncbi:MAG TPA: FGGY-family carbohydrate kinase, partial [Pirellulales bacterium]